jgi:ATP-dependent Clp protease ATP-binding subunit ClpC
MRSNGAELERVRKAVLETPPKKLSPEQEVEAVAEFLRVHRPLEGGRPATARKPGFEAYSPKARRAIFHARQEAVELGSPYIESEHLLLGLMEEGEEFLELFFGSKEAAATVRGEVEANSRVREKAAAETDLPLSNECKRALAYGAEEAERHAKEQISVEHLLFGLLREIGSFGSQMMIERGADPDRIRAVLAGQ